MSILRVRGADGKVYPIPAIKGEDGKQMFVRFSAYADGTDMSEVWDDTKDYMGIAFAIVAPTDKESYQWILLANLPNALQINTAGDLHVDGEVTYGTDNFSPRAEIGKVSEAKANAEHQHTAAEVTDLTAFFGEYKAAKIDTGSYVGTETSTEEVTNSLTFSFAPKMIVICEVAMNENKMFLFPFVGGEEFSSMLGINRLMFQENKNLIGWGGKCSASEDGKTVSWQATSPTTAMNLAGTTYKYLAIG